MPPERTQKRKRTNDGKSHAKKQPKQHQMEARDPSLSVSKIKSSLRQAKRFLQKDGLDNSKREETQTRVEELENQLKVAQGFDAKVKLEQEYSVKYHKIKFFERKKLERKIKQTLSELEGLREKDSKGKEKKKAKKVDAMEKTLYETRVDLNYVLHFPRAERYVALFPQGEYVSPDTQPEDSDATGKHRAQVRKSMRDQMASGELSSEPEKELLERKQARKQQDKDAQDSDDDPGLQGSDDDAEQEEEDEEQGAQRPAWGKKWKAWKEADNQPRGQGFEIPESYEEDEFFE